MTFPELKEFLERQMLMSHIYQPLLIKCLIDSGGLATVRQLAQQFLNYDESQVLFYQKKLKEMPIPVLARRGVVTRSGELVELAVPKINLKEKAELKRICESRIQEYIEKRGMQVWDYRLLESALVPDSLRYRVLKESKGRCALCGITKNESPLHVDHIIPRNKGGKTEYENLQALCVKCNCSKRDTDDTDFRRNGEVMMDADCLFCSGDAKREAMAINELAYARLDKFPVTPGHTLIIPKRHVDDYFDASANEQMAMMELTKVIRRRQLASDKRIKGFNVGINVGETAGQTIGHCHLHVIPRRKGDVADPRGGVRWIMPGKAKYW